MSDGWPWLGIAALGAYHGLNPAMGWLFAVALGMQERSRGAVLRALPPIAAGHLLSIAAVALLVIGAVTLIGRTSASAADLRPLRTYAGAILIAFGLFRLLAPRLHPRWVGMRVNARELTLWSFLMSASHGAGLMLVPILLGDPSAGALTSHPSAGTAHLATEMAILQADAAGGWLPHQAALLAVHTLAMLLVMGGVALLVFEKLGLALLRRTWFNFDLLWASSLVAAGALTLATG